MSFEAIKMGRIPNIKKYNDIYARIYSKQPSSFNNIQNTMFLNKSTITKNISKYSDNSQLKIKDIVSKNSSTPIIQTNSNNIDSRIINNSDNPMVNERKFDNNENKIEENENKNEPSSDKKEEIINNLNNYISRTVKLYLQHHEYQHYLNFNKKPINDSEINIQIVWKEIVRGIKETIKSFMNYAKEIPGLNEIENSYDFKVIITSRLFDYLIVI
jgi:hypothetical protein